MKDYMTAKKRLRNFKDTSITWEGYGLIVLIFGVLCFGYSLNGFIN